MASRAFAVLLLLVLAGTPDALAQTPGAATGNIDGTVTDRTGAVLHGVTIAVWGDALMGRTTRASGPDGAYRVSGLPPGTYTLEFSLRGFRNREQDHIAVALGATTTVNITLDAAAYQESVVVEGGVRVVDRHATTLATSFTAHELARLPGSRSPDAILWATPSVQFTRFDVGGSTGPAPFSAYGITGLNAPTIEGISVTGHNPLAFALDYGTFAEVSVGAGGYGPEWPSPGVHIQFITKSGGNVHHGSVVSTYGHRNWQSHNIDAGQVALGAAGSAGVPPREANRLRHYHDVNADAGGFLRPDRVWWYSSVRHQGRSARQVAFPAEPLESTNTSVTAKGTVRISDSQRVIVYGQRGINREPIRLGGFLFPASTINDSRESTASQLGKGLVWKAEWNAVLPNGVFAEVRVGQFVGSRAERPNGASPRFEDLSQLKVSGGHRDWQDERQNDQANGAFSFVPRGRLSRHHFKLGGEVQRLVDGERWRRSFPGDVLHVLQGGVPRQVYLFQAPSHSESGLWMYEVYASDSWQATRRLTLNLGIRFDRFRAFLPRQEHPVGRFNPSPQSFPAVNRLLAWNVAAPRVGASVDLGGDGRTIAKLSYGHYWLPPGTTFGFNLNPNQPVWWERWTWSDANVSGTWEPGEESVRLESRGGQAPDTVDSGLRLPYIREAAARLEREVAGELSVSVGVVWRGERQQGARQAASWPFEAFTVEASPLRDPGADAVLGTGDDGPDIPLRELPASLIGQSGIIVRNLPNGESDYLTWEFAARRRLRGPWSLLTWFSATWNRDHASGYFGQTVRANEFPVTPNDLISTDEQGRHRFLVWSARVLATYDGPWGIRVAPLLRHQSGQPFGRTLTARLNYGDIRVLAEPIGTRRQDHVTLFDLQVERDFPHRSGGRLTAFIELFNLLNANAEQQISWSTNTFLRPLAIVPPRIARVGFRLEW